MNTTQYNRVIPRDFFNEAKLLKCMGVLSLKILDRKLPEGIDIEIKENEDGDPFDIQLTEDGKLFVSNYKTLVNGYPVMFGTTYNSKSNYPLDCVIGYEECRVFDERGDFSEEFTEMMSRVIN